MMKRSAPCRTVNASGSSPVHGCLVRFVLLFLLVNFLLSMPAAATSGSVSQSRIQLTSTSSMNQRHRSISELSHSLGTLSSTHATSPLAALALALRGGSVEFSPPVAGPVIDESLDWNRVRLRLEGLSAYTVVSALLVNASLRLFTATPKKLEYGADQRDNNRAKVVFGASMVVAILAGLHTTVVFSFFSVYSKTALGLGNDGAYRELLRVTQAARHRAYDSFVLSLVAFQCSLVSSLFLTYSGVARWWAAGLAGLAVLLSSWHCSHVLAAASRLIFANPP